MVFSEELVKVLAGLCRDIASPTSGDVLLIFDNSTQAVAEHFAEAAVLAKLDCTEVHVPLKAQRLVRDAADLGQTKRRIIESAGGIVLATNDTYECGGFRLAVEEAAIKHGVCGVILSGRFPDVLKRQVRVDCGTMREQARRVSEIIKEFPSFKLRTRDAQGKQYELQGEVDSSGILIQCGQGTLGKLGRFPTGMVITCPIRAEGRVLINGSIPGHRIVSGRELLLEFDGHQTRFLSSAPYDSRALLEIRRLEAWAKSQQFADWCRIAEIGIGLNPYIGDLMGCPISDTKALGTLTIGVGDNRVAAMGPRRCPGHYDFVTWPESVGFGNINLLEALTPPCTDKHIS
jgi:hypothetical protein